MARTLDVWFHDRKAGRLTQDDSGRLIFAYGPEYLATEQRWPVSVSLPTQEKEFEDAVTRPFFSGLLPDEFVRQKIAKLIGVSPRNPFSLLEAVGGECAGAISFYPEGEPPHRENPDDIHFLDEGQLDEVFEELKRRPFFAGEKDIRLSLAGAQDKLAVRMIDGKLALMRGGAPTTHILKPLIVGQEQIKDSVHNELFCLLLARRCGLAVASAEIRFTGKQPFLLVERYDRQWQGGHVVRLHQEDFCQALSVPPENKYEREGGPSIAACLEVIQKHSIQPVPDRLAFLNIVIFNYLIGNADAHGKNFSLLHENGMPRLAPAYDLLCTAVYPDLSAKVAMRIGGKYLPDQVFLRHWHRLVVDTAGAKRAMEKTLAEAAKKTIDQASTLRVELTESGVRADIFDAILGLIRTRSETLLKQL